MLIERRYKAFDSLFNLESKEKNAFVWEVDIEENILVSSNDIILFISRWIGFFCYL